VTANKVYDLSTLDLGFIRPRNPEDWHLAYAQAQIYVQYIEKQHGKGAIGKLLAAFADGESVDAALARACGGVTRKTFEAGNRKHLDEVIRPLRSKRAEKPRRTLEELRAEDKKRPTADVAGELALKLFNSRRYAEARDVARKALDLKDGQPEASIVLARLAKRAGDRQGEKDYLERALSRDDPDPE